MEQRPDTDDALIRQLCADLDEYLAEARAEPPTLNDEGRGRLRPAVTSRRVTFGLAAASVAALVGGLVAVNRRGDLDSIPSERPPSTAPSVTEAGLPVPPTPDGWVLVEWGDVRFSVPPELSPFDESNGCSVDGGVSLTIDCPAGAVSVGSGPDVDGRGTAEVLNGLEMVRVTDGMYVPALGVEVLVDRLGASAGDVLATVGVSTRWRFWNEAAPPVPADWVPFELDGVRIMIPPDWPVDDLDPQTADPDFCGFTGLEPKLLVGRGPVDGGTAYCLPPPAVVAPGDGVRIVEVEPGSRSDNAPGRPVIDMRVFGGSADPSHKAYSVRIGFGVDGTIGLTILGSIIVHDVAPAATAPPTEAPKLHEAVATVLEGPDHGPQLCLGDIAASLPPQCGGPDIVGWSWDAIDGEESASGTSWTDAHVTGRYDPATNEFTLHDVRTPTDADRERSSGAPSDPDHGLPCDPPAGGWPSGRPEWPGDRVAAIAGYAGAWIDPTQRVMVAKFTGDLVAAEAAIRELYDGPLCVVEGRHTEADLRAIQDQLMRMSSIQFLWSFVNSDLRGEWVEAGVIAPDPDRQAAFDAEFGDGVVRLVPILQPVDG